MRSIYFALACWHLVSACICASPPSVIVILADDLGWGDLSRHGNRNLQTPHLDQMAREGAVFDRFTVQPVCSPTRAEMLTARYAPRDGVLGVTGGDERLSPNTPTLAEAFHAAGYTTHALGKWHNGTQAPYHPLSRGFQTFYGFTSGHWATYFDPLLDRNGELTYGEGFLPDDLTDEAIRLVNRGGEQPYFLWLAYNTPHSPMQAPERWWRPHADQELVQRGSKPDAEKVAHTRAALAMVENLDWNVGRLLDAIDRSGRSAETLVLFLTDNGPNGHRYNSGMRGVKGSTDFGGVRSPLFVRWPGRVEAGRIVEAPAAAIDIGPTVAELAGVALLDGPPRDGVSLAGAVLGDDTAPPPRALFAHWNERVSARRGDLLLDDRGRLYDLATDLGQANDLAETRPADAAALRDDLKSFRDEVIGVSPHEARPFTIGHPSLAKTRLPARDARASGGVKRSNRYFNCTYFSNWASVEDTIGWDVEVLEAGRYRAVAYYTCPEGETGSLIELSKGGAACRARVEPAYDPPLIAAQHDRYPRAEGDMKRFAPLALGEIDLAAGPGELTLRAIEIAGNQVMDFRLLELERIDRANPAN